MSSVDERLRREFPGWGTKKRPSFKAVKTPDDDGGMPVRLSHAYSGTNSSGTGTSNSSGPRLKFSDGGKTLTGPLQHKH